jgi:hypothetical protein
MQSISAEPRLQPVSERCREKIQKKIMWPASQLFLRPPVACFILAPVEQLVNSPFSPS